MQNAVDAARRCAAPMVLMSLLTACGGGSGGADEVAQACSPSNPYRTDATGPVVDASLGVEKQ